jgi:uncharacterized coiled-coil protein SlyX
MHGRATVFVVMLLLLVVATPPHAVAANDKDARIAELEERVAEMEKLLEELKTQPDADSARFEELERQIGILAEEIEDLEHRDILPKATTSRFGLGPAASKVYEVDRGVSIGGYGEMIYENFDSTDESGAPVTKKDQLDFLRLVLYFGYKFNDRIVFNSEIELEHASTGESGSASVEFAYLDFAGFDALNGRAGLLLVPMGFINEYHEPPTFLGAKRPLVDRYLIPTTWRENGAGIFGETRRLSYRAYVINSLDAVKTPGDDDGFDAEGIRGGRTKGSKSPAEDFALVGRLDWTPWQWLTLGGSFFTGDTGQGNVNSSGNRIGARTTIGELHGQFRLRGWESRVVYVGTTIDDVADLNEVQGFTGAESIGEEQYGWYAEAGWDTFSLMETRQALIPYVRYERINTQDKVPDGFMADPVNDRKITTVGLSYKPLVNVALKADYNRIRNAAGAGVNQVNVALGFYY